MVRARFGERGTLLTEIWKKDLNTRNTSVAFSG